MVRLMRRGTVSILEAVAEELPDVFTAEILPKLNLKDTLNLAQVNKCVQQRGVERGWRSIDRGEGRGDSLGEHEAVQVPDALGDKDKATCPRSGPS